VFSNPRGLQATDGLLDALVELLVVRTRVAEAGRDSRQLFLRTGIDAGEHQARRLLNDIAGFRAWLEQKQGHPGLRRAGAAGRTRTDGKRRTARSGKREPLDLESGEPLDLESGEPLDPVENAGQLEL
jgi:hypothetical protein